MEKGSFDKNESLKVKGLAICMMVFHHLFFSPVYIDAYGVQFRLLSREIVMNIALGMRLCVWVFAFISAYGLTKQYMKISETVDGQSCFRFIVKRWFALMKPYWLVFFFVVIWGTIKYQNIRTIFGGRLKNLLICAFAWSDFFGTTMPVNEWWYMCFAQIILFLIPIFYELCKKYGVLTLVWMFIFVPVLDDAFLFSIVGSNLRYMFAVVIGVLCAQNDLIDLMAKKSKYHLLCVMEFVMLVAGIVIVTYIFYSYPDPWLFNTFLKAIAVVCLVLLSYKYMKNVFVAKAFTFLGKHSGNIYLLHGFTYGYYSEFFFQSKNPLIIFVSVMGVCLICSVILKKIMDQMYLLKEKYTVCFSCN